MLFLELLIENIEETDEVDLDNVGDDFTFYNKVESTGIYRHYPTSLMYKTERTGSPGTLTGELADITEHVPKMGATIRLRVDNQLVFYGHIFQTSVDKFGVMSFTAYDMLRYLKNSFSSYYPRGYKLSDVLNDVAISFGLKLGRVEDPPMQNYKLLIDNESAFDVISKLVQVGTILSGRILVLYANGNRIEVRYADDMISDALVGDDSLATEYSLVTTIDEDTYNQIFLYRESNETGCRHFATKEDPQNVKKWGVLRLTESVDDMLTNAMIDDRASKMLLMKNRPLKTMTITALGIVGLRAGMMINIHFPSIPDEISRKQTVILDSVTHNFEDGCHTMTLEVHTFWRDM